MTDTKSTAKGAYKNGEEEKERDRRGRLLRSGEGRGERLYRRARQIGAPAPVILRLHYPCRSARPPCHSVPPLVILSAAKNLFSRLKDMARKILRSEAPPNDREEETVPPNDRRGGEPLLRMKAPLSFCVSTPPVILSEAKNLPSRLRGMA